MKRGLVLVPKKASPKGRVRVVLSRPISRARSQRQSGLMEAQTPREQIGAVVATRLTRSGLGDIRRLRIAAVAGYIWVGDGTDGTANSVYFQTAAGTYLVQGLASSSSGMVPIAISDSQVGQAYVRDVEKHFARKIIRRMWIHVDSLQPSTSNNMMAVIGVSRGGGGLSNSIPITFATASVTANTVANVSSMRGAFTVDSWESKCVDITEFIAGGSGPQQNEFDIELPTTGASVYTSSGTSYGVDGDGTIPACFAVAGNSTTAALKATQTHQVVIEQEVDLLDFTGGMSLVNPGA